MALPFRYGEVRVVVPTEAGQSVNGHQDSHEDVRQDIRRESPALMAAVAGLITRAERAETDADRQRERADRAEIRADRERSRADLLQDRLERLQSELQGAQAEAQPPAQIAEAASRALAKSKSDAAVCRPADAERRLAWLKAAWRREPALVDKLKVDAEEDKRPGWFARVMSDTDPESLAKAATGLIVLIVVVIALVVLSLLEQFGLVPPK
jgi:hypothetical protein